MMARSPQYEDSKTAVPLNLGKPNEFERPLKEYSVRERIVHISREKN